MSETSQTATRLRGRVKHILRERGYCFVRADGDDKDIFCHAKAFRNDGFLMCERRSPITFLTVPSKRRPDELEASDVEVVRS